MKNNRITIFGYIKGDGNENFEECLIDLERDTITESEKTRLRNAIESDGYIITREYFPDTELDKPNFIKTINF